MEKKLNVHNAGGTLRLSWHLCTGKEDCQSRSDQLSIFSDYVFRCSLR